MTKEWRNRIRAGTGAGVLLICSAAAGGYGNEDEPPQAAAPPVMEVRTEVRHVTVIVLPARETILEAVVGDPARWRLTAAANLAFLTPLAPDARSNVTLIADSGRLYAFRVTESEALDPQLVVRAGPVLAIDPAATTLDPVFVPPAAVAAAQERAAQAAAAVSAAEARAAAQVAAAETGAARALDAAREAYPRRMRLVYAWDPAASAAPFFVQAMWHDGETTYVRRTRAADWTWVAARSARDTPAEVDYELLADGLIAVPGVLTHGWFQAGDLRAAWRTAVPAAEVVP